MVLSVRSVLRSEATDGDGGGTDAPAESAKPSEDAAVRPRTPAEKRALGARTAGQLKERIAAERAAQDTSATNEFIAQQRSAEKAQKSAESSEEGGSNDEAIEAAPTAQAEKTAKAIVREGGDVPEQRDNESDKKYELRLSKALQDLRNAEVVTKREKARAEAAERKVSQFEKVLSRGKDPEAVLEFLEETTGLTLKSLIDGINEGKIKPPGARAKVDPAIQERLDKMETENARLAKLEEERQAEIEKNRQRALYTNHVGQARKYIEANADDFPLLSEASWAAEEIINRAYRQKAGDISGIARELEDSVATNVTGQIESEKALKALLKRKPELKTKLAGLLGLSAAPASDAKPKPKEETAPRAKPVSKLATEAPTPSKIDKRMTAREKAAHATSEYKKFLRQVQG